MPIPARIHFCWIGRRLSWAYVFAILSAAERGGMAEVVLHHTDSLDGGAELTALAGAPGVTLRRIDPIALLSEAGQALGLGNALTALYARLDSPVTRADVLRAAILFREGGIYLDLDTVTVASLVPLLDAGQFLGSEYIVWPHVVRRSRSPARWARALALDLMRKAMCRMDDGWRTFRRVQNLYYRGVNNAVMGAAPGSRFFARYLRAMTEIDPGRLGEAYALGPDLLQALVDRECPDDLVIHPPQVFYPLPPEISEHWFRPREKLMLDAVLSRETRVVHWYASVRSRPRVALIDPRYVTENRRRQLYSALVAACIAELPAGA